MNGGRLGHATLPQQGEHPLLLAGDDVPGDANRPVAAERPDMEVVVVVAAPDLKVRRGLHDQGRVGHVAAGLFVADDVRHF